MIDMTVQHKEESSIYLADDLIALYTAFRNQVYSPRSVLYPSCGYDASPSVVFSNVTFVDVEAGNEGCVAKLRDAGLVAFKQDIRQYDPSEEHDLLILLNPAIPTLWASSHLKQGGYVLSNDYHGNASEMYSMQDAFSLLCTMNFAERDRRKSNNLVVVSRDLEGLFEPVKGAEEFEHFRPSDFKFEKMMVDSFVNQRMVNVDLGASFEEKWRAYREMMGEGMPFRKVADRYVFVKK